MLNVCRKLIRVHFNSEDFDSSLYLPLSNSLSFKSCKCISHIINRLHHSFGNIVNFSI